MNPTLRALWEHYGGRCCYCRRQLRRHEASVDHYLPQALGGTNHRSNLRLACKPCNGAKADRHPDEWRPVVVPAVIGWRERRNALLSRCAPRYQIIERIT